MCPDDSPPEEIREIFVVGTASEDTPCKGCDAFVQLHYRVLRGTSSGNMQKGHTLFSCLTPNKNINMNKTSTLQSIVRIVKGAIILALALLFAPSLNAQACGVPLTFTVQEGFGGRNKIIIGGAGNNDASISWNCYPDSFTYGMYRAFNFNTGIAPPLGSSIPTWCSRIFHDPTTNMLRIENGDASCYDTVEWYGGLNILKTGEVGIGTDMTFGARFAVNGSVYTKGDIEINTNLAWPDFVFKMDYKKPSIWEFKKQVFQLGYIPQIGSAQNIEESGLKIAEMHAKHLEVTELMLLYQFEMSERLDSLANENTQLKSRLTQYASLDSLLNPALVRTLPALRPNATEAELKETIMQLLQILAKPEDK